ncbi:hypothetical protein C8J56DRAFT_1057933 [Mycena floridula]|nr:hypothetical protein C8J56DRAFT_1057933 [Mycena floridula]
MFYLRTTKLNEANTATSYAAGTGNVDPIHVDAIDDATKGIQVIPDRLRSPPLVEIEIGSPGVVEIGLEDGRGESRLISRMSESLDCRLSWQDGWENRVHSHVGDFCQEGICWPRRLCPQEGLGGLELFLCLEVFHREIDILWCRKRKKSWGNTMIMSLMIMGLGNMRIVAAISIPNIRRGARFHQCVNALFRLLANV